MNSGNSIFKKLNVSNFLKVISFAFSSTIIVQIFSIFRQTLITSSMGFTRELDLFYTGLAIVTVISLSLNPLYENIMASYSSPADVKRVEHQYINVLIASFLVSVISLFVIIAFIELFMIIYAAGFTLLEKESLKNSIFYFVPWVLFSALFSVTQAFLRVHARYKYSFILDIVVVAVSLLYLVLMRKDMSLKHITEGYAIGYVIAFLGGLQATASHMKISAIKLKDIIDVKKNILSRFFANQTAIFWSFAERYAFSFLPVGGISIMSIVSQISVNISSLLSFRDIFVYPVIRSLDRSPLFSRISEGLLFLSSYVLCFLFFNSIQLVSLLFEWGKVQSQDIETISQVLSIACVGLLALNLTSFMIRLFTIEGKNRSIIGYYISSCLAYVLGVLSVLQFAEISVTSLAMVLVFANIVGTLFFISRLKLVKINFMIKSYAMLFLTLVSIQSLASYLVQFLVVNENSLVQLVIRGVVYTAVSVSLALFFKERIKAVLRKMS